MSQAQSFKDHFSGHAGSYAQFRPAYPEALFSFLADACSDHDLAWDCATGNGQAARGLSPHFVRIVATDASEEQISAAPVSSNIEYRVAPAEASGLDAASIDLITVAQALHWFDFDQFFAEALRVLSPGGVIAVWSYERCRVSPDCNAVIERIFELVDDHWPPEREIVEDHYRGIELPVPAILAPAIAMTANWSARDMTGYMRTWSAARRYLLEHGEAKLAALEAELARCWGDAARPVTWPLTLKVGRLED